MRPLRRTGMNKQAGARRFRKQAGRTNRKNMAGPMRGGIRL